MANKKYTVLRTFYGQEGTAVRGTDDFEPKNKQRADELEQLGYIEPTSSSTSGSSKKKEGHQNKAAVPPENKDADKDVPEGFEAQPNISGGKNVTLPKRGAKRRAASS